MYKSKVSKILFATSLLIAFFESDVRAQGIKKCAEYGEYCQEHWQCCSNTCMTYSYKCVGGKRPQQQLAGAPVKPSMTLEQLLDMPLPRTETTVKISQQTNKFSNEPYYVPRRQGLSLDDLLVTMSPQLQNRFAEVAPATIAVGVRAGETGTAAGESGANVTTAAPTQCKSIGEKCYRHDECCTKRCHGFLHQCVT